MAANREPIESGCLEAWQYLHPAARGTFGPRIDQELLRPGAPRQVAYGGARPTWTVKASPRRILDVFTLRRLCEIGDQFADGFVHCAGHSSIAFIVERQAKVEPLIRALQGAGFVVGVTRNAVSSIAQTQGLLTCDILGPDRLGVARSLMDALIDELHGTPVPNRVRITTSGGQANLGSLGDIAIDIQRPKPPKIRRDLVARFCEHPAAIAPCPAAARRPRLVDGKRLLAGDGCGCVSCGVCYLPSSPTYINAPDPAKLAISVGGPRRIRRGTHRFQKLVVAGVSNNPPHWPEAVAIVKRILTRYNTGAQGWERVGDWIERIGWRRFFEAVELPFTAYQVDTWRGARASSDGSSYIRF